MGKSYEMAFAIGAKVSSNFGSAFRSAAQQVQALQTTIDQLNKRQSDISSYQKTATAIDKVRSKLQLYQQQYANLKEEIERNGQASASEQNQLLAKGKAIDDAKDKLAQLEAKLATTGEALQAEGVDLNNLGQASAEASQQVQELRAEQESVAQSAREAGDAISETAESFMDFAAAAGIIDFEKKIAEAFKECAQESINFENSMASVKRTVGGSDSFITQLGSDFKQLSTQIPISTGELAQIASTAGQLGIAQDKVESFTTVMAKLATTTDLTADEAATMLAQFSNITGISDYERLGSTIAQLGDSTATTASKVVEMSQGMAASASIAGMRPTDIMAISAAVGSLGIEAQAGSTAMSQLINSMYRATETGEKLKEFASVAGMSADQFKQSWGEDAIGTFNAFIQGLNDVERNGKSAIVVLDELGINNVRQTKAILGLASAGDLLTETINQANQAWQQNSALSDKAAIMYDTTQSKLTMLGNAFSNIKISIGDAFTPAISGAAEGLTGMMVPVAEFIESNPALVQGVGAAIAVMGGLTAAVAAYTAAAKAAAIASAALAGGAKLFLGIGAAAALLIGGIVAFGNAMQQSQEEAVALDVEYKQLMNDINQQQHIIDLCNEYEQLSSKAEKAVDVSKKLQDFEDVEISLTATAEADVKAGDFLEGDPHVTLTGGPDGEKKLDATAFVNGTEISFKASWANREDMARDIESLKKAATEAQTELKNGKQMLAEMKDYAEQLQERLLHAGSQQDKDSITQQLEDVNAAIEAQTGKVDDLQTAYNQAAGKYALAAAAAEELYGVDARLAEIQDELGISASSAVGGIDAETDAILAQVEAKKALAEAEQAGKKAAIYNNVGEMSKQYAQEAQTYDKLSKKYQTSVERAQYAQEFAGQSMDEVSSHYRKLIAQVEAASKDGDIGLEGVSDKINEILGLAPLLQKGFIYFDHGSAAENWKALSKNLKEIKNDASDSSEFIARAYENVEYWGEQVGYSAERMNAFVSLMAEGVASGAIDIKEAEALINSAFADTENGAEIAARAIGEVKQAVDEMKGASQGASDSAAEVAKATQPVIDKINELSEAYTNAYNSAYQSISGQFDLFEKMELPTKKSSADAQEAVDGYKDALESQAAYLADYQANWEQVKADGLNEGLLQQLSDGSEKSAQILADLVAGGADKIDDLNQAFSKVENGKKQFADSIAEMETNFTAEMEALKGQLDSTVVKMNKTDEAASAGAATVQAFADAASGKVGAVSDAFAKLSAAAKIKASFSFPTLFSSLFGFAGGTSNAPRGLALVGEEGPELVYLHGGEQILNADETQHAMENAQPVSAMQSGSGTGSSYHVDIHNQYDINGTTNADELKTIIEENNRTLREQIEDTLADLENDRHRRAYA